MLVNSEGVSAAGPFRGPLASRHMLDAIIDILYNEKTRVNHIPPVNIDRQTGAQGIVYVSKPHFLKKYGHKVIAIFL